MILEPNYDNEFEAQVTKENISCAIIELKERNIP